MDNGIHGSSLPLSGKRSSTYICRASFFCFYLSWSYATFSFSSFVVLFKFYCLPVGLVSSLLIRQLFNSRPLWKYWFVVDWSVHCAEWEVMSWGLTLPGNSLWALFTWLACIWIGLYGWAQHFRCSKSHRDSSACMATQRSNKELSAHSPKIPSSFLRHHGEGWKTW